MTLARALTTAGILSTPSQVGEGVLTSTPSTTIEAERELKGRICEGLGRCK